MTVVPEILKQIKNETISQLKCSNGEIILSNEMVIFKNNKIAKVCFEVPCESKSRDLLYFNLGRMLASIKSMECIMIIDTLLFESDPAENVRDWENTEELINSNRLPQTAILFSYLNFKNIRKSVDIMWIYDVVNEKAICSLEDIKDNPCSGEIFDGIKSGLFNRPSE